MAVTITAAAVIVTDTTAIERMIAQTAKAMAPGGTSDAAVDYAMGRVAGIMAMVTDLYGEEVADAVSLAAWMRTI